MLVFLYLGLLLLYLVCKHTEILRFKALLNNIPLSFVHNYVKKCDSTDFYIQRRFEAIYLKVKERTRCKKRNFNY